MRPQKSSNRKKIHDYIVYLFIIVSIICIAYPIIIYVAKWGNRLSSYRTDWEMFSSFMGGTLGPIVGMLSLLVTTYIVYEFNLYQKAKHDEADTTQLQQTTINLFKEFRSPQMATARSKAWELKKRWDAESTPRSEWIFRKALIEAMVNEQPVHQDDNFIITSEHLRAVNDMISFYTMLSLYEQNEQNIKSLSYFYYPWWRSFLKELTAEADKIIERCNADNAALNVLDFDKVSYIKNIKMGNRLQELDMICGFDTLSSVDMICGFERAKMI